jgi:hypothetical protein
MWLIYISRNKYKRFNILVQGGETRNLQERRCFCFTTVADATIRFANMWFLRKSVYRIKYVVINLFLLFFQNTSMSVSVCVSPTNKILNQLADFHKIQQGGHAIERDLESIIFNSIVSTILKRQKFKLLRWMQNLHQSVVNYQGLSFLSTVTRPLAERRG